MTYIFSTKNCITIRLKCAYLICLPPSDCESPFVCKPLQLEALTDYENIIRQDYRRL